MNDQRTIVDYLGIIATAFVVAYLLAEWIA